MRIVPFLSLRRPIEARASSHSHRRLRVHRNRWSRDASASGSGLASPHLGDGPCRHIGSESRPFSLASQWWAW
jgi:hypothetical protein